MDKTVVVLRLTAVFINGFFAFGNAGRAWAALVTTLLAASLYLLALFLARRFTYRTINLAFVPLDLLLVTAGVHLAGGMASATYLVYFVEITIAALYAGFRAAFMISIAASLLYLAVLLPEVVEPNFWWDYGYRASHLLLMGLGVGFLGHHLRQQVQALRAQKEEAGRNLARSRALSRLAREVNADLALDKVLDTVLVSAVQLLSVAGGAVALLEDDGSLRLHATNGVQESLRGTLVGSASRWPHPFQTRTLGPATGLQPFLPLGFIAGLEAPIAVDDQLVGTLLVLDRSPERNFNGDERESLESLAGHAAVALKNARLYEESYRRAEFLASVNEVGKALASTLRPEELYPTIHRGVSSVMPMEGFFIALWEEETGLLHVKFHIDAKGVKAPYPIKLQNGPTLDAIQTKLPVLLELEDEAALARVTLVGDPEPPRSLLVVPLLAGDRVIGAMSAQSYRSHAYNYEHLELLSTVGGLAASALENARLYQRTLELSLTDPLTGLGNARHFHQQLDRELKRAQRYGHPVTLLMLDSDSLKSVNDHYGHETGDQHIRQLAGVISSCLRESDLAFRYAGDEFMAILPETPLEGAMRLAERIRAEVEHSELAVGQAHVRTTVSIGVASFPSQAAGSDELIRVADSAMYMSKQSGKNRVTPAGLMN